MTRKRAVRIRKRENRVRRWCQQVTGEAHRAARARRRVARGREISASARAREVFFAFARGQIALLHLDRAVEHFTEIGGMMLRTTDTVDAMALAMRSLASAPA